VNVARVAILNERAPTCSFEQLVDLYMGCGILLGHSNSVLSDWLDQAALYIAATSGNIDFTSSYILIIYINRYLVLIQSTIQLLEILYHHLKIESINKNILVKHNIPDSSDLYCMVADMLGNINPPHTHPQNSTTIRRSHPVQADQVH